MSQTQTFQKQLPRLRGNSGFSLIEILIVLMILATLGSLVSRSISQAIKAKIKIQKQIDESSRLRDAIKLLERDIQLAYHHQDWEKELQDLVKKKSTPTPVGNPGTNPQGPKPPSFPPPPNAALPSEEKREVPRLDPTTHFVGTLEGLDFVTMNQMQMSRDSLQADFVEVGYFVKECRATDGKASSKCLWRRSSNFVDSDPTKGGEEMVLLENVSEFKLRYIGPGKQDWVETWKTNASEDLSIRNKFPTAVEVSLSTEQKILERKGKTYSMQVVIPIHFPNNWAEKPDSTQEKPEATSPNPAPAGGS